MHLKWEHHCWQTVDWHLCSICSMCSICGQWSNCGWHSDQNVYGRRVHFIAPFTPATTTQEAQIGGGMCALWIPHEIGMGNLFVDLWVSCHATLELQEDLQTVGTQPHHSVRLRDPFRTQTRRCPATLELQEDIQTVGNKPSHSVRLRRVWVRNGSRSSRTEWCTCNLPPRILQSILVGM